MTTPTETQTTQPAADAERATPHVYIRDLSKHAGEEVTLRGWLYNLRSSGKLIFPQLRDGTGLVQ